MNFIQAAARLLPRSVKEAAKKEIITRFNVPSMDWSLENMRRLGFRPRGVLDIGAYLGEWTEATRKIFPDASYLMLEAQADKREALEKVKAQHPASVHYRIALLGPENREQVEFNQYQSAPTGSSMLADHGNSPARRVVCRMETLDSILAAEKFLFPELIKIDVQGYELEVLKGAPRALASAQAIAMEVSLMELYRGNPLMHEVIAFMYERGFQAYDVPTLMRRPSDQALWQIDIIFVKATSALFKDKTGLIPAA